MAGVERIFFFSSRDKSFLNPSTEFWVLPKTYPLRKYIYTKSKKSNKEALCVTNQSHIHDTHELMSKMTFKLNSHEESHYVTRECPRPENSASSPSCAFTPWASDTLLSSVLSAHTSFLTPKLSNIYDTFATFWNVFFHHEKKNYKWHCRKLEKWFVAIWPETHQEKSRFIRLCTKNQCPLIFKSSMSQCLGDWLPFLKMWKRPCSLQRELET